MMNKLIIAGIILSIAGLAYWNHMRMADQIGQQKGQIARLEGALQSAGETIAMMGQDAKQKGRINIELRNTLETINHENDQLRHDLASLATTEAQSRCDGTPLPDGYVGRLRGQPADHPTQDAETIP